jgi:hypothetical protein
VTGPVYSELGVLLRRGTAQSLEGPGAWDVGRPEKAPLVVFQINPSCPKARLFHPPTSQEAGWTQVHRIAEPRGTQEADAELDFAARIGLAVGLPVFASLTRDENEETLATSDFGEPLSNSSEH